MIYLAIFYLFCIAILLDCAVKAPQRDDWP